MVLPTTFVTMLAPLLSLSLELAPPDRSRPSSVPSIEGGQRAPEAWAALTEGALWVCWQASAGETCWKRYNFGLFTIDEELAPPATDSPHGWRLGFRDGRTLSAQDPRGQSWTIRRGNTLPSLATPHSYDDLPLARTRSCSIRALSPVYAPTGWSWQSIPRCARDSPILACRNAGYPSLRRPSGLQLKISAEIQSDERLRVPTKLGTRDLAPRTDKTHLTMVTLMLGFSAHDRRQQSRSRAALVRAQRRSGHFPAFQATDAKEALALQRASCGWLAHEAP